MRWFKDSDKKVVLVIDEVDRATNNQVFLDFLAQLRSLYLKREKNTKVKTFQSVILAGVNDSLPIYPGSSTEQELIVQRSS